MVKVSLVLPTWNAAFVINQTIDSIFNQSDDDFECIIINDASTDSTKEILSIIDDDRFTIINNDKRYGAGYSRNIGNSKSNSNIICVCDAGDILYSNKVADTKLFFDNYKEVDIMCSGTDSLEGSTFIMPRRYRAQPGEKLGFEHPGVAYRKSVTERIKYRETSLETDQYDAFFFEAGRAGFKFEIYPFPLSAKCTFTQYTGGRNLDKALLVKIGIYREFNIPIPEWLTEHERKMNNARQ